MQFVIKIIGKLNRDKRYIPIIDPIIKNNNPALKTLLGVKSFSGKIRLPPLKGVGVVAISIPLL